MYHAIVFLPLLGAIIAALITLVGAHARFPGGSSNGHDHASDDASHLHTEAPAGGAHTEHAEAVTAAQPMRCTIRNGH